MQVILLIRLYRNQNNLNIQVILATAVVVFKRINICSKYTNKEVHLLIVLRLALHLKIYLTLEKTAIMELLLLQLLFKLTLIHLKIKQSKLISLLRMGYQKSN